MLNSTHCKYRETHSTGHLTRSQLQKSLRMAHSVINQSPATHEEGCSAGWSGSPSKRVLIQFPLSLRATVAFEATMTTELHLQLLNPGKDSKPNHDSHLLSLAPWRPRVVLSSYPKRDCFLLKAVGPWRCGDSGIALCTQPMRSFLMLPSLSGKGLFALPWAT